MADISIRPTAPGDAELLAADLRESDIAELNAVGFDDVLPVIRDSVAQSTMCWSAFADGELACIIGAVPLGDGFGAPWMLGTPVLDRNSRTLVRLTPQYIKQMLAAFPVLFNFVHADNITSTQWLRRLGFTLGDAQPHGTRGALFHPFEMRA